MALIPSINIFSSVIFYNILGSLRESFFFYTKAPGIPCLLLADNFLTVEVQGTTTVFLKLLILNLKLYVQKYFYKDWALLR